MNHSPEQFGAWSAEYAALNGYRTLHITHIQQWLRLGFGASLATFAFFWFPQSEAAAWGMRALGSFTALVILVACFVVANLMDQTIVRHCYPRLVTLEILLGLRSVCAFLERRSSGAIERCRSLPSESEPELWRQVQEVFAESDVPFGDRLFSPFFAGACALAVVYVVTLLYSASQAVSA